MVLLYNTCVQSKSVIKLAVLLGDNNKVVPHLMMSQTSLEQ
jgi:hypothetical protein